MPFRALALAALTTFAAPALADNDDKPQPAFPVIRCMTILSNLDAAVRDMNQANQDMGQAYAAQDMEAFDDALNDWGNASRAYNNQLEEYERGDCEGRTGKPAPDAPGQWTRPKP